MEMMDYNHNFTFDELFSVFKNTNMDTYRIY